MATTRSISADILRLHGLREQPSRGFWEDAWIRFRKNGLAFGAAIYLLLLVVAAYSAPLVSQFVTGYDPAKTNLRETYRPPSAQHWFGTDEFGRDYFTRLLYGGQVSLTIGFIVAAIQMTIGLLLGLTAGYFGGKWDDFVTGLISLKNGIPSLFLLIILAAWIVPTVWTLSLIIGFFGWTGVARQIRGVVLSTKRRDYVEAGRALGGTNARLMFRHVLPNVMSIVLVVAGFDVAAGVSAETGLSFIGLGIRPPTPSWGNMLTNSFSYLNKAPYLIVFPGLAIFTTILAIFLAFDGLRDALDPRLKGVK